MARPTFLARRKLLAVLILFFSILVAVELCARFILGLGDPPLSMEHPTIEYMFKPNQDVLRFGNRIIVNQYGMRSSEFPKTKDRPDELRIMVYGDSIINGGNLTDHSELATTILQQSLCERLPGPVTVGNISAGSWGPTNILAHTKEYGFFDADVVVLVLSSYDYADVSTFAPLDPNTHPADRPLSAAWEGVTRYFPRYLRFGASEKGNAEACTTGVDQEAVDRSLSALGELIRDAQAEGARVVLVQHWMKPELETGTPYKGHDEIRSVVEQYGVPVYQDYEILCKSTEAGSNPYHDIMHLNVLGQTALASLLEQTIDDTMSRPQ